VDRSALERRVRWIKGDSGEAAQPCGEGCQEYVVMDETALNPSRSRIGRLSHDEFTYRYEYPRDAAIRAR
jgi:hypothetical protein